MYLFNYLSPICLVINTRQICTLRAIDMLGIRITNDGNLLVIWQVGRDTLDLVEM